MKEHTEEMVEHSLEMVEHSLDMVEHPVDMLEHSIDMVEHPEDMVEHFQDGVEHSEDILDHSIDMIDHSTGSGHALSVLMFLVFFMLCCLSNLFSWMTRRYFHSVLEVNRSLIMLINGYVIVTSNWVVTIYVSN